MRKCYRATHLHSQIIPVGSWRIKATSPRHSVSPIFFNYINNRSKRSHRHLGSKENSHGLITITNNGLCQFLVRNATDVVVTTVICLQVSRESRQECKIVRRINGSFGFFDIACVITFVIIRIFFATAPSDERRVINPFRFGTIMSIVDLIFITNKLRSMSQSPSVLVIVRSFPHLDTSKTLLHSPLQPLSQDLASQLSWSISLGHMWSAVSPDTLISFVVSSESPTSTKTFPEPELGASVHSPTSAGSGRHSSLSEYIHALPSDRTTTYATHLSFALQRCWTA